MARLLQNLGYEPDAARELARRYLLGPAVTRGTIPDKARTSQAEVPRDRLGG